MILPQTLSSGKRTKNKAANSPLYLINRYLHA
ncbi:hypothetical protein FP742_07160 [Vibrio parahaemolyticus]|uniref:Uncharacterized protein n=1 Tax=Vibrio parahaemolyticus serotype O3:K6 (strain RIMD 2210633) TaxID=223926 RepID=Q87HF8_VIBPA|nr:hypothetical protein A6J30_25765 [Vibrio parahaemolyticus]BAC62350.1 hypothetical protein [Vibrio parahaemolyticus RIMD 2210633]AZV73292.1 hypothetical protein D0853_20215 [Vibrio parahaemolyticus]EGQ8103301.1 hypothetical protein [Vibrio parahaemolyticus]EGQ8166637.1 hypothetical protein [Vibrio parahaemolyticus]